MEIEEAVKIVAKFDSSVNWAKNVTTRELLKFYLSLDNLVPAWEKLEVEIHNTSFYGDVWMIVLSFIDRELPSLDWCTAKTLQQAAAIATAKAIQELK